MKQNLKNPEILANDWEASWDTYPEPVPHFPHEGRALTSGNAVLPSVKLISQLYFLIKMNELDNLSDFSSLYFSSCKSIKVVCKREVIYNNS